MAVAPIMSTAPRELVYFLMLTPVEQAAAIQRMSNQGWTDYGIAGATRLSVEQVRRILGEPKAAQR
jgi:hypothetical protein